MLMWLFETAAVIASGHSGAAEEMSSGGNYVVVMSCSSDNHVSVVWRSYALAKSRGTSWADTSERHKIRREACGTNDERAYAITGRCFYSCHAELYY